MAAPESPPSAGGPRPPPPADLGPPPPRRTGPSRTLLAAILATVVVLGVVLALLLGGAFHGTPSPTGKAIPGPPPPPAGLYGVTFSETGLPASSTWTVDLGGTESSSSGTSLGFFESNGTYAWTAHATGFQASPASGSVVVAGSNRSVTIGFAPAPAATYGIAFAETGLPAGTSWQVTLAGSERLSSTALLRFTEPNGSYAWSAAAAGYTAVPSSGNVTIAGSNQSASIVFSVPPPPPQYGVTFSESGLPAGTEWSVTLDGSANASNSTEIGFRIGNGNWPFSIGAVAGYASRPSSGEVGVSGGPASEPILFSTAAGRPTPDNFSTALRLAEELGRSGAIPVVGVGIDVTQNLTDTTPPGLNASCPFSGGTDAYPTLPAWTGNYHDGNQTVWFFFLYSASPSAELQFLSVSGPNATLVGTLTQASCLTGLQYATGIGSVLNSPTVAADIASNDAAYLAAYPTATSVFAATSGATYAGFPLAPALWNVTFTTCGPAGGGSGHNFSATVNATSGVVEQSATYTGVCGGVRLLGPSPGGVGPDRPMPGDPAFAPVAATPRGREGGTPSA